MHDQEHSHTADFCYVPVTTMALLFFLLMLLSFFRLVHPDWQNFGHSDQGERQSSRINVSQCFLGFANDRIAFCYCAEVFWEELVFFLLGIRKLSKDPMCMMFWATTTTVSFGWHHKHSAAALTVLSAS